MKYSEGRVFFDCISSEHPFEIAVASDELKWDDLKMQCCRAANITAEQF